MNVNYIIPIRKHLAKFLYYEMKYNSEEYSYFTWIYFTEYAGYCLNKRKLYELFIEKKLFKKIKPNQYPNEFISKYPTNKFTYLMFNLPVTGKRLQVKGTHNFKQFHDYDCPIHFLNSDISKRFWREGLREVFLHRDITINQAIINFYKKYGIVESDYKIKSFKTMLYKMRKKSLYTLIKKSLFTY